MLTSRSLQTTFIKIPEKYFRVSNKQIQERPYSTQLFSKKGGIPTVHWVFNSSDTSCKQRRFEIWICSSRFIWHFRSLFMGFSSKPPNKHFDCWTLETRWELCIITSSPFRLWALISGFAGSPNLKWARCDNPEVLVASSNPEECYTSPNNKNTNFKCKRLVFLAGFANLWIHIGKNAVKISQSCKAITSLHHQSSTLKRTKP